MSGKLRLWLVNLVNGQSIETSKEDLLAHKFDDFDLLRDRVDEVVVVNMNSVVFIWSLSDYVSNTGSVLVI